MNLTNAVTFIDVVTNTIVNSANTITTTAPVTDLEVLGSATVIVNAASTDGKYGIISNKINTLTYEEEQTPTNDIAYTTGKITLPKDATTGSYNSDTEVEGTDFQGSGSAPIFELFGEYTGETSVFAVGTTATIADLKGGRINLADSATATIALQSSGTIIGTNKTSEVTFSGNIEDGDFRNFTAKSFQPIHLQQDTVVIGIM